MFKISFEFWKYRYRQQFYKKCCLRRYCFSTNSGMTTNFVNLWRPSCYNQNRTKKTYYKTIAATEYLCSTYPGIREWLKWFAFQFVLLGEDSHAPLKRFSLPFMNIQWVIVSTLLVNSFAVSFVGLQDSIFYLFWTFLMRNYSVLFDLQHLFVVLLLSQLSTE